MNFEERKKSAGKPLFPWINMKSIMTENVIPCLCCFPCLVSDVKSRFCSCSSVILQIVWGMWLHFDSILTFSGLGCFNGGTSAETGRVQRLHYCEVISFKALLCWWFHCQICLDDEGKQSELPGENAQFVLDESIIWQEWEQVSEWIGGWMKSQRQGKLAGSELLTRWWWCRGKAQ